MKRFMLLHFGFEKPTPEIMAAWRKWFESAAGRTVDQGGFHGGAREISHHGTRDLPMGKAESLEGVEALARDNPFIAGIRVYEIVES